jgi:hypothetical protein
LKTVTPITTISMAYWSLLVVIFLNFAIVV